MYIIRDKKTKAILEMLPSALEETSSPEKIYPGFNPDTMEMGRTDEPGIPAWFTIEKGVVKPMEPPEEPVKARLKAVLAEPPLEEAKASSIAELSRMSLELRQNVVPDYQVQNASLGVYDENQTQAIRETVKAFRDEFYRLKSAIEKARTSKELQGLKPEFPTKMSAAPKSRGNTTGGTEKKGKG